MAQPRSEDLLSELLRNQGQRHDVAATSLDERSLMRAANKVGTPTLREDDVAAESSNAALQHEVFSLVQRYPLQSVALAIGVAYLIGRSTR